MAQVSTTIRLDRDLKEQFVSLCSELGMSINTAFTIFAKKAVRSGGIPFMIDTNISEEKILEETARRFHSNVQRLRESVSDLPELSLDEINAEISAVRNSANG